MSKTYLEMSELQTLDERYEYLKTDSRIGESTFGFNRYLNQSFYTSPEWKSVRRKVILRDNGCELGVEGCPIDGPVIIHHINPITAEDIINRNPKVFDLNNLVCVSHRIHNAIHFGDKSQIPHDPVERKPNDTCPWKTMR